MINHDTIVGLHQKLKNKEFSAYELIEACVKEAHELQPILNSMTEIVDITPNRWHEKANNIEINDYLDAIPYFLKDNFTTKYMHTTASSYILHDYVPFFDATVTKKFKEANTLMIGKTSMDEFGMGGTNLSAKTGPVNNPWDLSRISGGSSGGSAVMVAAGVVPFATGSDTGDSIRKPAAYCGIVGLKPSYGRASRYGIVPYGSSLDCPGIFTRSVEDAAIVLEKMSGRDDRDMTTSFLEVPNYFACLNKDMTGKKLAVIKEVNASFTNQKLIDNFNEMVEKYREMGAIVEEVSIDKTLLRSLSGVYQIIANAEACSNHSNLDGLRYGARSKGSSVEEIMVNTRTDNFSTRIKARFAVGALALNKHHMDEYFIKAQKVRTVLINRMNEIFSEYDAVLTPTSETIAPRFEDLNKPGDPLSDESLIAGNHLVIGNFIGAPGITIPTGFVDEMPVSINIMTKPFNEQEAFDVAFALESILPYKNQIARVVK